MKCEIFGNPNRTTCGETMYSNTHFRTQEEAWESIEASAKAGIQLDGRALTRAKEALREAERRAADAAERYAKVMERRNG